MVWTRKLDVPVAQVWKAVSTKQGLDNWWMCPVEIDLRPGGLFAHWWQNTITDLQEHEYIHFGGVPGSVMRFELRADGQGTVFSFLDTWAADAVPEQTVLPEEADEIDRYQPGGPGTPWAGVAGGWHGSLDELETYLTGRVLNHSYEHLCRFYAGYLADHFRWRALMSAKQS
jgi:uncharacterized protein YndB with AHSA1/START domain